MTITPFIKGNYTLVGAILLYLTGVYFVLQSIPISTPETSQDLLFLHADQWLKSPQISAIVNSLLLLLGGILLLRLNNLFSIIPKRTLLPLIFFLLFELATPQLSFLCNGNAIVVVMILILFPFFLSYQQVQARSAFLIMGIISTCTLFCPLVILYIPLLLIGFLQIRYLNIKSILGGMVGWVTPFWILIGLGTISLDNLHLLLPTFTPYIPDTTLFAQPQIWIVVLTVILGFFAGTTTIYSTLTEKRQIRAYNGFITLLSIYTTILLFLDYTHYTTYLPILNMSVALQAAFFFTGNTKRVGVILFYLVLTLYLG